MPKPFRMIVIIGACVIAGVVSASATLANPAAEGEIRNRSAAWLKAYNAGDADAVLAFFAEDAVVMPPGAAALRDSAAIRGFVLKGIAGAKARKTTLSLGAGDEVDAADNLAWHSGPYALLDQAGTAIDTGKYLEVWRKTDGNWQMIRRIWNSDRPAPAATGAAPADTAK